LSSSSGEELETERKGRRNVKLVTNLSGENDHRCSGGRPSGGRQMGESDLSSSSFVEDEGDSDEEVKPLKKRRISGGLGGREQRLGFDEPVRREVLLRHFFVSLISFAIELIAWCFLVKLLLGSIYIIRVLPLAVIHHYLWL
jgi:hypothetical protein